MKFPKEIIIRFEADAKGTTVTAMDDGELIRCKDCKDYQTDWEISHYPNRHYCATMDSTMPEDGFCSYAERKQQ